MRQKVGPAPATDHACCPTVQGQLYASMLRGEDFAVLATARPWPGSLESSSGSSGSSTIPAASNSSVELGPVSGPLCSRCQSGEGTFSVFAVFDGHNGPGAAQLARDKVLGLLEDRLPWGPLPRPGEYGSPAAAPWRGAVQRALVETLVELDWLFGGRGESAGCTATLVLQVGWLLTVANLGDSRALLDLGWGVVPLTQDHRVATHRAERRRLEASGARVAPISIGGRGPANNAAEGVGPLRVWPGGLCLSRALGDFDVGDGILPFPFVKQVLVPPTGARLVLASDGLWDAFDKDTKVTTLARGWAYSDAPTRLVETVTVLHEGLRDDTTVIVADLMPGRSRFSSLCARYSVMAAVRRRMQTESVSGGCFCFGGSGRKKDGPADPSVAPGKHGGAVSGDVSSSNGTMAATSDDARPEVTVLAELDVAALLGLMPEPTAAEPLVDASVRSGRSATARNAGVLDEPASVMSATWCDDGVAAELRRIVRGSVREWRRAMTCRYRGLYVPEPEPSGKWLRGTTAPRRVPIVVGGGDGSGSGRGTSPEEGGLLSSGAEDSTEEAGGGVATGDMALAATATGPTPPDHTSDAERQPASNLSSPRSSLPRSSSHLFRGSVAADEAEYAAKFGHYKKTANRGRLFPEGVPAASDVSVRPIARGCPDGLESGVSMRVGDHDAAVAAATTAATAPGGSAALSPRTPSSPSTDSDPSVRPRTRSRPPVPLPPPTAHLSPSPFAVCVTPPPSPPTMVLAGSDDEPSVRVGTPRLDQAKSSSDTSEGDGDVGTAAVAREASRDVLRDNPRVHFGLEDSVSEAVPASPVRGPAVAADGLRPVRVVRRPSLAEAGGARPAVADAAATAAPVGQSPPSQHQQQCWAEVGPTPDPEASAEAHKVPVILQASG